jgi:hypothetical protein
MGELDTVQIYEVNAFWGLDLYKAPLKSDTNKILRMKNGSIVTRVNNDVQTVSKLEWYNVRYVDEENDEVGWTLADYLELRLPLVIIEEPPNEIPMAQGPRPGSSKPSVATVTEVYYKKKLTLHSAHLRSLPDRVDNGLVTYNFGGVRKETSFDKWNAAAARNSKLKAGRG